MSAERTNPLFVAVARLPQSGQRLEFDMTEAERSRIAQTLGLVELQHLSGTLDIERWQKSGVRVSGPIEARAIQESVVTLEPVERAYAMDFRMTFVPDTSKLARIPAPEEQELFVDPEGEDPPETFSGEGFDLSPYIEEQLALELDPFPRNEGEAFEEVDTDPEPEEGKISPFAGLSALKKQQGDEN
ncbi:DUF177 domain-containing protein [Fulvimarina endophytica]|uniref:DUF177 domain-containing protein n=1 Tax=Fulvimarina endophytica TaxID=2293836 RepID=A0A371X7B6_9HYPH|nr:DUF177 domain-containing protein [Fulvimarina endophytica]RFC65135.1 DUF177 domain-containing protein [Fulvimarina endophytica]